MPIIVLIKDLQSLTQLRTGRRPTYRDIAARTGLGVATVSNLANQRNQAISFNVLEKLCKFFECEPGDLLKLQEGSSQ